MNTSVMVSNLDPKTIHWQIMQLEEMQQHLQPDDSVETACALADTLTLLHNIEEEIRHKAREERHH